MMPIDLAQQDCDDTDRSRFAMVEVYLDSDLDGVGAGQATSVCSNGTPPFGYSLSGTDCAPEDAMASRMVYCSYRDADADFASVYAPGSICAGSVLPAGYSNSPGFRGSDCDDARADRWQYLSGHADQDLDGVGADATTQVCSGLSLPSGWLATGGDCADDDWWRWRYLNGHADRDLDGVGEDATTPVCSGSSLPSGWLTTGGDCADDDRSRWWSFAYSYRDADGDSYTVYSYGTLCIGANVPSGYLTSSNGSDCNDTDPTVWKNMIGYVDEDEDGVGAGSSIQTCTDGTLPDGQVTTGGDCASADPDAWRNASYAGRDEDGDGYTTRAAGTICTGEALPPTYAATVNGNDCDDGDTSLWRWVVLYPDRDGDGVGAPPRIIPCLGEALPEGYSLYGWDEDDSDPGVVEREELEVVL